MFENIYTAVIHLADSADKLTLILVLSFFLYFIFLAVIRRRCDYYGRPTMTWDLLCFLPLTASIVHFGLLMYGSASLELFIEHDNIYIPAILIAFFPLLGRKKVPFIIGNVVTCCACIFLCAYSLMNASRYVNLTRKPLSEAYLSLCDELEESYPMNDWKKIDYDEIKKEGLPKVKEAEKTGDINKYYEALDDLVYAFHDEHMGLDFYTENDYFDNTVEQYKDYGLALVRLDDGSTIAVDVEEGLDIKEGDIVTKWDGVPVDEAAEKIRPPMFQSVAENERILQTFFLSATGGDKVTVSYKDSNGKEHKTELSALDSKKPRVIKAVNTFTHDVEKDVFRHEMLNDTTGYLYIGEEETDMISDGCGYLTGDHKAAREMFREDLEELKAQGMEKLIIDIRNNDGGYDEVSTALASLFTDEKVYAFSLGVKNDNGKGYKKVRDSYILPDGEFSGTEVVVLTNMQCGSAGDGMTLYMSRIDGVTIAGITDPAGVNQETGGHIYLPEGAVIDYPIGVVLNKKSEPNIDVNDSRESRDPVDVRIPLDKQAALKIFSGTDYELEWAMAYLGE